MRWRALVLGSGVLAGFMMGVGYAWLVHPARFADAEPASLRADFRDEYIALIASAYQIDGNEQRAQARIALFPDLRPEDLMDLGARLTVLHGADASGARAVRRWRRLRSGPATSMPESHRGPHSPGAFELPWPHSLSPSRRSLRRPTSRMWHQRRRP